MTRDNSYITKEYIENQRIKQTILKGREVEKIDAKTGRLLATYPTLTEASLQNGIDLGLLCNVCQKNPAREVNGKSYIRKTAGGFAWRYTSE